MGLFSKKEETTKKPTVTVNSENLNTEEFNNNSEEVKQEQIDTPNKEVTIQDVLENLELRIINLESTLFRMKGAI